MPTLHLLAEHPLPSHRLAHHVRNGGLWVSPCGEFVALPVDGGVAVLGIDGDRLVERARFALPDGLAPPDEAPGYDERGGLLAGAVSTGGRAIAVASTSAITVVDATGARELSVLTTEEELASGAVDDEDARWLGDPDALAFDHGGALWTAGTHIDGIEKLTRIDAAAMTITGSVELESYPEPAWLELAAAPDGGIAASVGCGQDGAAAHSVRWADGAATLVPAIRFSGAPARLVGWAPEDNARIVLGWSEILRVAPDRPDVLDRGHGGDLVGAVVGRHVVVADPPGEAGHLAVRVVRTADLAEVGAARLHGSFIWALAGDRLLSVGGEPGDRRAWLYQLQP